MSLVVIDTQQHPAIVRITPWVNAAAMLMMIASGWRIYDWDPIFPFASPFDATLGGEITKLQAVLNEEGLAGALQWHFAGMWLLTVNFIIYLGYGLASRHFRRDFLPIEPLRSSATLSLRCVFASSIGWATTMPSRSRPMSAYCR